MVGTGELKLERIDDEDWDCEARVCDEDAVFAVTTSRFGPPTRSRYCSNCIWLPIDLFVGEVSVEASD